MVTPAKEENNYPKAIGISLALMGGFLVLSFFWYVSRYVPEEVGTGGIIVNYGTSDVGMGSDYTSVEEPSQDPNANGKAPDNVSQNDPVPDNTPQTSDKQLATQDNEEAPVIENSNKKSNAAPTVKPDKKESKPAINPNALYKGPKNNATGQGDGTGTTPGNQGQEDGDPLSDQYGEGGSGFGNTGLSLKSRRYIRRPDITDNGKYDGKITVEFNVGKDGSIINPHVVLKGTTITDRALWQKCVQAMQGSRLNQLDNAPDIQVGRQVFNFKFRDN